MNAIHVDVDVPPCKYDYYSKADHHSRIRWRVQQLRYRVVQWGTGHSGMHSLRNVIEHPRFDLIGVYVYTFWMTGD